MIMRYVSFILILVVWSVYAENTPFPKRKRQDIASDTAPKINIDLSAFYDKTVVDVKQDAEKKSFTDVARFKSVSDCPHCPPHRSILLLAIESFWNNDLLTSYGCACNYLLKKPNDGFAQAIMHALTQTKYAVIAVDGKVPVPTVAAPSIRKWEILGPMNVGKLEVDGDPTFITPFDSAGAKEGLDVGSYLLRMRSNATVFSELASGGKVTWTNAKAHDNGEVLSYCCNCYCYYY
jgi:hypothetical protein